MKAEVHSSDIRTIGHSTKTKWFALAFLCCIFVIYTIDRALLGLLVIPIQREIGLSDVKMGILNAAIFWTYAIFAPFSGLVADRIDRARLIGIATTLWSLMALLSGLASDFWSLLLLVSFAMVVPQTFYAPSANTLIASLHKQTRTLAMSMHQAAFYFGWLFSGAAVATALSLWGTWRSAFVLFGSLGIIAGVLFLAFVKKTEFERHRPVERLALKESIRACFGCKSALLAGIGYVAVVFAGCGYCAWGPKFITMKFNVSAAMAGAGVMFWHYAVSFMAILIVGAATDALVVHYPRIRLGLSMFAMAVAIPALLLFALGKTLAWAFMGSALLGVSFGAVCANQFTNLFDVIRPCFRSAAVGFLNVIAALVGSLAPLLIGWQSQIRGIKGFEVGFAIVAALMLVPVAAFAVSFFVTFDTERIVER